MQWLDNQQRYGLVSMLLHWVMALLLFALLFLGWRLGAMGNFDPQRAALLFWHQGLGLTAALLMFTRMLWRWRSTNPRQGQRSPMEKQVLRKVRLLMYLLVFIACISGYLLVTGGNREVLWFDVLVLPQLYRLDMGQVSQIKTLHMTAVWSLAGFVCLHVLATFKYQLINKEPILQRMLGRR